jgi:hypothetical protein
MIATCGGAEAKPMTASRNTMTIADPSLRTGASDANARIGRRQATYARPIAASTMTTSVESRRRSSSSR